MKKVFTILILLAVVAGCILAAGCTGANNGSSANDVPENIAYTVTVQKEGTGAYNVGDIVALTFVTNPTTGYDWHLVKGNEVLYKEFSDADQQPAGITGAPSNKTFWFQADKEGNFPIELVYARSWDMENTTISTFSDVLNVVKSDEPNANGPIASFTFDSFDINPTIGSYVKIVTAIDPTPKRVYSASGDNLVIKGNTEYAQQGFAGSSQDVYTWYVTAAKAGDYTFKATLNEASNGNEVSYFTIPLKFTKLIES